MPDTEPQEPDYLTIALEETAEGQTILALARTLEKDPDDKQALTDLLTLLLENHENDRTC